jgi:ATP-binding cassette subfamily B protein/subfamily B ATP-binding cassette protein MsbA
MIGVTAAELLTPWPFKMIFDYILLDRPLPPSLFFLDPLLQSGRFFSLVIFSVAILLIAFLKGGFSYLQVYNTARIGYQWVHTLRGELFSHLQRLSLLFHYRARSGELLTKVTSDTNTLKDVFADSALVFLSHVLTVVGMFAIMFSVSWKLSLIVLSTFPLLFYALSYLYGEIKVSAKEQRKQEGKIASRIAQVLTSLPLVQSFGRERYEEEQFQKQSAQTLEESIRTARLAAAGSRVVEIVSAVGTVGVVLYGSIQVINHQITPGDVLVFLSYLASMYKPIRDMAKLSAKFSKAVVSAGRINDILKIEPEIVDGPHAVEVSDLKGEIIFQNVSFDYGGGRDVLKEVSFRIAPGQKVALVGASGAGKSTVVSLILRLHDPHQGSVLIDGFDVKRYQRESLRRRIGIVLQDSVLFGATIQENISYGKPDATQEEIEEAARQAHADDFIMALPDKYETVLGERGVTLSGGQRQRIAIARAIVKKPSILILDEPTSAVDAESARRVGEAIEKLQKGKTILAIVHQFSSIKSFDHILVLKNGVLVEQGTHEELLLRKGYYFELFQLQRF